MGDPVAGTVRPEEEEALGSLRQRNVSCPDALVDLLGHGGSNLDGSLCLRDQQVTTLTSRFPDNHKSTPAR